MRAINDQNQNHWHEVEKSLEENTSSGFKMACIEAEKSFRTLLEEKHYPTENLEQTLTLFGWKLTNKEGLKKALEKANKIKNSFDYRLSSFEAEDIVEVFKQAICDFTEAKPLTWQRKVTLFLDHYLSFDSSFFKKALLGVLSFFLLVKTLAHTAIGQWLTAKLVSVADFIFSWLLLFILISIGVFIFVITVFVSLDKKKTRIKSIK
jgi:hypothetical protein